MLRESYPYYLASEPGFGSAMLDVRDKYTGKVATRVALADRATVDAAIAAAAAAAEPCRKMPAYARAAVLNHCIKRFQERFDELAESLCIEAGKPIKDARGEVTRLIDTFRVAAEESTRMTGEIMDLEISPRAKGYSGMWKRVPVGAVSFISPFNFPLNLVAHKIAPAIAVGCPWVLKPATRTPIGSLIIGEILAETDLPKGAFSVLPCNREDGDLFTTDPRLKLLSFTGSPQVGWDMKARAGKKKVILELGGNAACIVDEGADLDDVVKRIVIGAFYQSGQSCISVQRIIAHRSLYAELRDRLVVATKALKMGDPREEDTFIGPVIDEREAIRLQEWVHDAVDCGATLLCGGGRKGPMFEPTLLEGVPRTCKLYCEEAFGPVAVMGAFDDFDDAIREANDSAFGLQAGVFTRDIYKANKAWNEIECGGVVIGDVPSWRVDHMPYGGVKDSGVGREGVKFAMEDLTEIRLMVLRTAG